MSLFAPKDFNQILENLINNHSIFYKFWSTCRPTFSEAVETAAVSFDKNNRCISFLINPSFWKEQSLNTKKFIICHECLHILNFHAKRVQNKFSYNANCAMDIVVNESLVKYFRFSRPEIDPKNEYCWLDTCFDSSDGVEAWENFEYYLNLLNKKNPKNNFKFINLHENLSGIPGEGLSEFFSSLSEEEKETIQNILQESEKKHSSDKGEGQGNSLKEILETFFPKKKKWESLIKKFEKTTKKQESLRSHWINRPRRLSSFKTGLFTPNEVEDQKRRTKSNKIDTWFFLDTSGSCWNLAERFFKAAKSLDPKIFDVKYFYFDTAVYPTDLKKKQVLGGGGTSFSCISSYIESKKQNPYVWVLTDGFGDRPQVPLNQQKKWSWFLTSNSSRECIPEKCKIYFLSDFE